MRIPRDDDSQQGVINMSSLLDVMFILIIFFLATATFEQQEKDISVNLPDARLAQSVSAGTGTLTINVRQDGRYYVANRAVTRPQLDKVLTQAVAKNPKQKVLVRGDEMALFRFVAGAIASCKVAGIHEANIGFDPIPR